LANTGGGGTRDKCGSLRGFARPLGGGEPDHVGGRKGEMKNAFVTRRTFYAAGFWKKLGHTRRKRAKEPKNLLNTQYVKKGNRV